MNLWETCYDAIMALTAEGKSVSEIAEFLHVGKKTVNTARKRGKEAGWDRPAAWRAPVPPEEWGPRYTCDTCGHGTRPESGRTTEPYRECERCGNLAYPPLSDAEVERRLTALVRRLEEELGETAHRRTAAVVRHDREKANAGP